MTRETKIGMVVAVSFLCLVGIVVATKWRRNADDGKQDLAQVANPQEPAPGEPNNNPPPKAPDKKNPVEPADFKFQPLEPNPAAPLPSEPAPAVPVPAPLNNPASILPELPATTTNLPPAPQTEEEKRLALLNLTREKDNGLPLPPLPAEPFKTPDTALVTVDGAKNKATGVLDNTLNRGNDFANKGVDKLPQGFPKVEDSFNRGNGFVNEKANDLVNKVNNQTDQLAQGTSGKFDELLNKGNNAATKGLDNLNKSLDNATKTQTPPPPTVEPSPAFPPAPLPNGNANPAAPPAPMLPSDTKLPAIPAPKENGLPPTMTGNPSGFVIPAPAKSSDARVVNYDVQTFPARPGDTFASLSKQLYGDEKYANALLAYNREFSTNRNMTALQAGQTVLLPPIQILQDRYATALADVRPKVGGAAVSISPPVPVIPNRNAPTPTPSADLTKSYRIPAGGQKIYELAIQTLGDGSRWTEIYRLNPAIDPLQPIPGNMVVRLPGNANVP